jgi:hypothetical protein
MRPSFRLLFVSTACLMLTACTTTTGTRASGSAADIAALKRVAAVVRGSSEFSVQRDRERMTVTGAVFGSFLGAAIETAARTNSDTNFAQTMKPAVGDFDAIPVIRDRLLAALRATPTFASAETTTITDVATLRQAGFGGLLDVEVPEWGLRLCTSSQRSDDLQVTYRAHGRLVATGTAAPLWERHELFVDGDCRPADAWRNEAGLLRSVLARAADRFAKRLVNDLLFP